MCLERETTVVGLHSTGQIVPCLNKMWVCGCGGRGGAVCVCRVRMIALSTTYRGCIYCHNMGVLILHSVRVLILYSLGVLIVHIIGVLILHSIGVLILILHGIGVPIFLTSSLFLLCRTQR